MIAIPAVQMVEDTQAVDFAPLKPDLIGLKNCTQMTWIYRMLLPISLLIMKCEIPSVFFLEKNSISLFLIINFIS